MILRQLPLLLIYIITIISGSSRKNRIAVENSLQGTNSWWYDQLSTPITIIHGFSDQISYYPGDVVSFKISHPLWMPSYQLEIYRLGYYHGLGGRLLANITSNSSSCSSSSSTTTTTTATTTTTLDNYDKARVRHRDRDNTSSSSYSQPPCKFEFSSRMTDCSNWNISMSWVVPYNMITGIMIALPVYYSYNESNLVEKHYGNYIPFIIKYKPNHIGSDILFKTSDTTWVAYNKYGNWNIYRGNGSFHVNSRAYKASYNRPWQNRYLPPEGQYHNFLFGSEYPMLYWLEQHSYDVSYMACKDVEELLSSLSSSSSSSSLLSSSERSSRKKTERRKKYHVLLSVGHDEYWTTEMRSVYEEARNNGIHLAFFSGNEMFWRIIWDQDQQPHSTIDDSSIDNSAIEEDIGGGSGSSIDGIISNNHNNVSMHNHKNNISIIHDRSSIYSSKRVFICGKETIDNNKQVTAPHDWTGTFRDPRYHRITAAATTTTPENALTGQLFMVNAHRNDSIHVTYDHAFLRFWRDTDIYSRDHYDQDDINFMKTMHNTTTTSVDDIYSSSVNNIIYHNSKYNTHVGDRNRVIRKEGPYNNHSSGITKNPIGITKDPKGIKKDPRDIKYTTPRGVLGYEWDVSIDDYHRPSGWFSLSSTTIYINKSLLMQYGAYYNGSGYATHQLSLYRYYKPFSVLQYIPIDDISSTLQRYNIHDDIATKTTIVADKDNEYSTICLKDLRRSISSGSYNNDYHDINSNNDHNDHHDHHDHHNDHHDHHNDHHDHHNDHRNTTSALVFGAGTVQWSWALSDRHDGYRMPVDINLQQATANLLADMDVFPVTSTTTSGAGKAIDMDITCIRGGGEGVNRTCVRHITMNSSSKDYTSPKSTIRSARIQMIMIIDENRAPSMEKNHRMLLKKHGIYYNRHHLAYYHTNQYYHVHNSSKQSKYHEYHHHRHHHHHRRRYLHIYGTAIDYGGGVVSSVEVSVDLGRTWQLTTSHLVRMTTIGMVRHWHVAFQIVDVDDDDSDDGNDQNRDSNIHNDKDNGDSDDDDDSYDDVGCCQTDGTLKHDSDSDSDSDRIRSDFVNAFREHVSTSMSLLRNHCRCTDHTFNDHNHHNRRRHLKQRHHHNHRYRLKHHHHHHHHRFNQSSDHIVVISRAVDDSGWIEPVDITSTLCKLHTLRYMIIHNNYTTTTTSSSSSSSSSTTSTNSNSSRNDDVLMKMELITHNVAVLSYT